MNDPNFFLEGIIKEKDQLQNFEGPLSLILLLLSKNKIEIRDINISDILEQYLEYLDKMQSMDLEIASEFVQMAAQLLYIKTKTLLSQDEEVSELEELMSSLEQLKCRDIYASLQKLVPELQAASQIGMLYYTKQPEPIKKSRDYEYRHEPVDLFKAMLSIYSRGGRPTPPDMYASVPKRIVYSIKDKSIEILEMLRSKELSLRELYGRCTSRSELVAAFMSVLELCSTGSIRLNKTDTDYSLSFSGGNFDEIMGKITEQT